MFNLNLPYHAIHCHIEFYIINAWPSTQQRLKGTPIQISDVLWLYSSLQNSAPQYTAPSISQNSNLHHLNSMRFLCPIWDPLLYTHNQEINSREKASAYFVCFPSLRNLNSILSAVQCLKTVEIYQFVTVSYLQWAVWHLLLHYDQNREFLIRKFISKSWVWDIDVNIILL